MLSEVSFPVVGVGVGVGVGSENVGDVASADVEIAPKLAKP